MNGEAYASGNPLMAGLGDIPLLQDTASEDVWASWAVTYRDVIILDGDNRVVDVYNLTSNDLNTQANYDALKARLIQHVPPTP